MKPYKKLPEILSEPNTLLELVVVISNSQFSGKKFCSLLEHLLQNQYG